MVVAVLKAAWELVCSFSVVVMTSKLVLGWELLCCWSVVVMTAEAGCCGERGQPASSFARRAVKCGPHEPPIPTSLNLRIAWWKWAR
jgi:hypothetical protein